MCLSLFACQKADDNLGNAQNNDTTTYIKNEKFSINKVIKVNDVKFIKTKGKYPLFIDTSYQAINQQIQDLIDELVAFDKLFEAKDVIGGVDKFDYVVLNFDENQFSFKLSYAVTDMTSRYFAKYYQIDLKNKKKVLLSDFLKENAVNVAELNKAINDYVMTCKDNNKPEYCHELSIGDLLNLFEFNHETIDVLKDSDSFYVVDNEHIVIAFNTTNFTTTFKINIKTYQIDFN